MVAGSSGCCPRGQRCCFPIQAPPAPQGQAEQAVAAPFDEVKLASLRASGKPVFLYFTAD